MADDSNVSKYSTYKKYTTSTEVSYASHTSKSTYQQQSGISYSTGQGVKTSSTEVVTGTSTRNLPVYVAIQDYIPAKDAKDSIQLDQGQIVEVLDNKNPSSWLVRTKSRPPETGWVPGSYFETPTEYYQQKRTTREITAQDISMTRQEEAAGKRDAVYKELVQTEETFVAELRHVIDNYVQVLDDSSTPAAIKQMRDQLFLNFRDLYNFHANVLLKGLQYYADDPGKAGQTFVRLERDFDHHVRYCKDEPEAEKLLDEPIVKEFFDEITSRVEVSTGKSLKDYLRLPFIRLEKYQSYMKELIKYSVRAEKDTRSLQRALELMLSIPQRATDLAYIRSIQGYPGETVKLGRLIRHEYFNVWEGTKSGAATKRYIFLFKNKIVICNRTEPEDVDEFPEFQHVAILRLDKYDVINSVEDNSFEFKPLESSLPQYFIIPFDETSDENVEVMKKVWEKDIDEAKQGVGDDGPPKKRHKTPPTISPSASTYSLYSSSFELGTGASGTLDMQGTSVTKTSYGFRTMQQSSAKMCLKVTGFPLPTITWFKDGQQLIEGDRHSFYADDDGFFALTIEPVHVEDTGLYSCVATNEYGSATTSAFFRVLKSEKDPAKPNFIKKITDIQVKEGEACVFNCEVEGWPEPEVFWLVDGDIIHSSQDFKIDYDGQKGSLEIRDAQIEDAGIYTVRISNELGHTECTGKLSVLEDPDKQKVPPEFQKKLNNVEVKEGDSVRFKTVITGDPVPDVAWYINGSQLTASTNMEFLAEDGIYICTISDVPAYFDGEVNCRASNRLGEASCTARLTVISAPQQGPEFIDDSTLKSQTVSSGDSIKAEVKISAAPAPVVSWTLDDKPLQASKTVIITENHEKKTYSIEIKKSTTDQTGTLGVKAVNEFGQCSSEASITVKKFGQAKPDFQSKLSKIEISEGDTLRVKMLIAGDPVPQVKWTINDRLVVQTEDVKMIAEDGVYILSIEGASQEMNGEIKCTAYNKMGESVCTAPLVVNAMKIPVEFEQFLADTTCHEGDTLKLKAILVGEPPPEVTWYINKTKLIDGNNVQVFKEGGAYMVVIKDITCDMSGEVLCKAINEFGEATSAAQLTVLPRGTPPDFTEWLSNVSAREGKELKLRVVFTGEPTPVIEWMSNGIEVKTSDRFQITTTMSTSTLVIKNFSADLIGEISCKAENDAGEVSCTAQLSTSVVKIETTETSEHSELEAVAYSVGDDEDEATDTALSIPDEEVYQDKDDFSLGSMSASAGNVPHFISKIKSTSVKKSKTAMFECMVPESKGVVVKWLKDGKEIVIVTRIRVRSKPSTDGAAQIHELIIDNVVKEDAGTYQVVISNEAGQETCTAELKIDEIAEPAPEIVTKLTSETVEVGETVGLTCKVKTTQAKPDIHWYFGEKEIKETEHMKFKTEKNGSLHLLINEATLKDTGSYRCEIVTSSGTVKTTGTLEVKEPAPKIITELQSETVTEGETVGLTCKINKLPTKPEVKWFLNDKEVKETDNIKFKVDRTGGFNLLIQEASLKDAGSYRCEIKSSSGTAKSSAKLEVKAKEVVPEFGSELHAESVVEGETVGLSCQLKTIVEKSEVHWYLNDKEIKESDNIKFKSDKKGGLHLLIQEATIKDAGSYRCEVVTSAGTAKTTAKVEVKAKELAPEFASELHSESVLEGDTVGMTCKVKTVTEKMEIHWYVNDKEIKESDNVKFKSDKKGGLHLLIQEATTKDVGTYRCEVVTSAGTAKTSAKLEVKAKEPAPEFATELHSESVIEGDTVGLSCKVKTVQEKTEIHWYLNDKKIKESENVKFKSDKTGNLHLMIKEATLTDAGSYRCEIVSSTGTAKTSSKLEVSEAPPEIITQLHSESITVGETVGLTCKIKVMKTKPEIHWYLNDKEVKQSDNITFKTDKNGGLHLLIKEATLECAGTYRCEIVSTSGTAKTVGKLEVEAPKVEESAPEIISHIQTESVFESETVTLSCQVKTKQAKPEVHWYLAEKEVKETDNIKFKIEKNGTLHLLIKEASLKDAGSYRCEIVTPSGTVSSTGGLEVQAAVATEVVESIPEPMEVAPEFTRPLKAVKAKQGETVTLECGLKAEAKAKPQVHWYKGDEEIKPDKRHDLEEKPDGSLKLIIKEATEEDIGQYRCEVITPGGAVNTEAPLEVKVAAQQEVPAIIETAPEFVHVLEHATVEAGQVIDLQCMVKAETEPQVRWFKGDDEVKPDEKHEIQSFPDGTQKLTIKQATESDVGEYRIEVVSPGGFAESKGTLSVNVAAQEEIPVDMEIAPEFTRSLKAVVAEEGMVAELECAVRSESKPDVKWFKGDVEVLPDKRHEVIASADGAVKLIIKEAKVSDIGEYRVEVATPGGKASAAAPLEVRVAAQQEVPQVEEVAPEFTKPLQSVTAEQDEQIALECAVATKNKVEIHWFHGDKEVKPDSVHEIISKPDGSQKLIIKQAKIEDVGDYRCEAVTPLGTSSKTECILDVKVAQQVSEPSVIEVSPEFSQPLKAVTAKEGETVALECAVKSDSKVEVKWFKGEEEVEPDAIHEIVSKPDGSQKLIIKEAKIEDVGDYRCEAVAPLGASAKTECALDVKMAQQVSEPSIIEVAPEFSQPLKAVTAKEGETVALECAVKSSASKVEVKWFKGDEEVKPDAIHEIVSKPDGSQKLIIKEAKIEDVGDYRCEAVAPLGTSVKTECALDVKLAQEVSEPTESELAPEFSEPLKAVTASEGETVALECAVKTDSKIEVKWFKGDKEVKPDAKHEIESSPDGKQKLVIKQATTSDVDQYRCEVATEAGKAETTAKLAVKVAAQQEVPQVEEVAPEFTKPLQSVTAEQGEQIALECAVATKNKVEIHWFHGDEEVKPDSVHEIISKPDGSQKLIIKQAKIEDVGDYRCEAVTPLGTSSKTECILDVKVAQQVSEPSIIEVAPEFSQPLKAVTAKEGETVALECAVKSDSKVEVKWFKGEEEVKPDAIHEIVSKPDGSQKLIIKEAKIEDVGDYRCEAVAPLGASAKTECALDVKMAQQVSEPAIAEVAPEFSQPLKAVTAKEGETVALECAVKSDSKVEVKWFKGDQEVKPDAKHEIESSPDGKQKLVIKQATTSDVDQYRCEVATEAGKAETTAKLAVKVAAQQEVPQVEEVAPEFTKPLQSVTAEQGEQIALECAVATKNKVEIHWFHGDEEVKPDSVHEIISKPDGSQKLIIKQAKIEDVGDYRCEAVTPLGASSKTECILDVKVAQQVSEPSVVEVAPEFSQPLKAVTAKEGETVALECAVKSDSKVEVKWFKGDEEVKPDAIHEIVSKPDGSQKLIIKEAKIEDVGDYRCEAVAPLGASAKTECALDVKMAQQVSEPAIAEVAPEFSQPLKAVTAKEGESVALECAVKSDSKVEVKWFKGDKEVKPDAKHEIESSPDGKQKLVIKQATTSDVDQYRCEVATEAGKAETAAKLAVKVAEVKTQPVAEQTAPEFVEVLKSCQATESEAAEFVCKVTATPAPQVKWLRDGKVLKPVKDKVEIISKPDGTQQLILKSVKVGDTAEYRCEATNTAGKAFSEAPLTVKTAQEQTIPSDEVAPDFVQPLTACQVEEGQEVRLLCKAVGVPQPEIRWLKEGKPVNASKHIKIEKSDDGTQTLIVKGATLDDIGEYRCEAKNTAGTTWSDATLNVQSAQQHEIIEEHAPEFLQELEQQQINEGEHIVFECKVKATPAPVVQWFKDGEPITDSDHFIVETLQDGTQRLEIKIAHAEDQGNYKCEAVNPAGAMSSKAPLSVQVPDDVEEKQVVPTQIAPVAEAPPTIEKPEFAEKLAKTTAKAKDTISLPCKVLRKPNQPFPTVCWFKDREDVNFDKRIKAKQNEDTGEVVLTIKDANEADAGLYQCTIRNDVGVASCETDVIVEVTLAPDFAEKLKNVEVMASATATLSCKVNGKPKPEVKWFRNGKEVSPGDRIKTDCDESGNCSLVITSALEEDAGSYSVKLSNSAGFSECRADLVVKEPAPILVQSLKDLTEKEGNNVVLSIEVDRKPKTIKWYKAGKEIKTDVHMQIERVDDTHYQLVIEGVQVVDSDEYSVTVSNEQGEDKSKAKLVVKESAPNFIKGLVDTTEKENQKLILEIQVDRKPKSIKWYKADNEIKADVRVQIKEVDQKTYQLVIKNIKQADAGEYRVVLSNDGGESESIGEVTVQAVKPSFAKDLSNQNVMAGKEITLSADVEGRIEEVKWQKNGKVIKADGTKIKITASDDGKLTLLITDAEPEDADKYSVEVSNEAGFVTSEATVAVEVPAVALTIVRPLKDKALEEGGDFELSAELSGKPQTVKWYKNGRELNADNRRIKVRTDNGTKVVLVVGKATKEDQGTYKVVATNEVSAIDSQATVEVSEPEVALTLKLPLKDASVVEGVDAEFTAQLVGTVKDVKWFKNGQEFTEDGQRVKITVDSATGKISLKLSTTEKQDAATYKFVASNLKGSVDSEAKLTVTEPIASLKLKKGLSDKSVEEEQYIEMSAVLDAAPDSVKWYKERDELKIDNKRIKTIVEGEKVKLVITSAKKEDMGKYKVIASNPVSSVTTSATLTVTEPEKPVEEPVVKMTIKLPLKDQHVVEEEEITLTLQLETGEPTDAKWSKNGKEFKPDGIRIITEIIKEELEFKLTIKDAKKDDEAAYKIEVFDQNESITSQAAVTVDLKPVIEEPKKAGAPIGVVRPLKDQIVEDGKQAILEVEFSQLPVSVTWRKDGKPLTASETIQIEKVDDVTYQLIIPIATKDVSAEYSVEAKDENTVIDSSAKLTVKGEAPKILKGLVEKETTVGVTVMLEIEVTGKPRIVKWYRGSQSITSSKECPIEKIDDNTFRMTIPKTMKDDTATYKVVVTNDYGSAESTAKLTVKEPPKKEPKAEPCKFTKGLSDKEVDDGQKVILEIEVSGKPKTVKWYKNGQEFKPDGKRVKVESMDDKVHRLVISTAEKDDHAEYKVVVENEAGSVDSSAKLSVRGFPPRFIKGLVEKTSIVGSSITLDVEVEGKPKQVKWYKAGNEVKASKSIKLESSEETGIYRLVIAEVTNEDSAMYKVEASNDYGTTATEGRLTVEEPPKEKGQPPVVNKGLTDKTITEGDKQVFEVVVGGGKPTDIKWYRNGRVLKASKKAKIEQIDDFTYRLTLPDAIADDGGMYKVELSNEFGTVETSANLTVKPAPELGVAASFILPLKEASVTEEESVTLTVKLKGDPAPDITWYKDNVELQFDARIQLKNTSDGTSRLTIKRTEISDVGTYAVFIKNRLGSDRCESKLNIEVKREPTPVKEQDIVPEFTKPLRNKSFYEGEDMIFEVRVVGRPMPDLTWFKDGTEILFSGRISGETECISDQSSFKLTITESTKLDSGTYKCVAKNSAGEAKCQGDMLVEPRKGEEDQAPKFVIPLRDSTTTEGKTLTLDIKVRGRPTPQLKWLKDGKEIDISSSKRIKIDEMGDNRWKLIIENAEKEDDGTYECIAENPVGSEKCSGEITISPAKERKKPTEEQYAPRFNIPLHDRRIPSGNPMSVECFVSAKPNAEIKWSRDGESIEASDRVEIATMPDGKCRLRIIDFTKADAGNYRCLATNSLGSANTKANLTVEYVEEVSKTSDRQFAPRFVTDLSNCTAKEGSTLRLECKVEGNPRPHVIWFKDGIPVKLDADCVDEFQEDGTCILTVSNASEKHGGAYRCVASNSLGTSNTVGNVKFQLEKAKKVEDGEAPQFIIGIKQTLVDLSTAFSFTCTVIGNPTPTIKWYKDGIWLRQNERLKFNQQENGICTMTCNESRQSDEGLYRCVAENTIGSASSLGSLQLSAVKKARKIDVSTGEAPKFVIPLEDATCEPGKTFTFECKVTGKPVPQIRFSKDGQVIRSDHRLTLETTSDGYSKLTIKNIRTSDDGIYRCMASNDVGSITSASRFMVSGDKSALRVPMGPSDSLPHFAISPNDVRATVDQPMKITCRLGGIPLPEIKWYKDGELLAPNDRIRMETRADGTSSLWVNRCTPDDAGIYRCVIESQFGTANSKATVVVKAPFKPAAPTENGYEGRKSDFSRMKMPYVAIPLESFNSKEGFTANFVCKISGTPLPSLKWFKDGERIYPFGRYEIKQQDDGTTELIIRELTLADAGVYRCLAENDIGSASTRCQLGVEAKQERVGFTLEGMQKQSLTPGFIKPLYFTRVQIDADAVFECLPYGNPAPTISWLKDGITITSNERYKIETLEDGCHRLTVSKCSFSDEGFFRCVASNPHGVASSKAELLVEDDLMKRLKLDQKPKRRGDVDDTPSAPRIRRALQGLTVAQGSFAQFECAVTGYPRPTIKWYRDNVEIQFSDRYLIWFDEWSIARLVILNTIMEDEGQYRVEFTNDHGSVTSEAHLTMLSVDYEERSINFDRPVTNGVTSGVDCAPGFLKQLRNKFVYTGTPAIFDVVTCGCPAPEVEWYRNGQLLRQDERISIRSCGGNSYAIIIYKAKTEDAGEYMCLAKNRMGNARSICFLEVNVPFDKLTPFEDHEEIGRYSMADLLLRRTPYSSIPTPPNRGPFIAECTDHYLTLSWIPTLRSPPRYPQVTYIVEIRELPDRAWTMVDYNIGAPVCKVRNLEKGKSYQFRVRAENLYGISDPSPCSPTTQLMAKPKPVLDRNKRPIPNWDPFTKKAMREKYADQYACAPWFAPILDDHFYCVANGTLEVVLFVQGYPDPDVKWAFRGWDVDTESPTSRFSGTKVYHTNECVLKIKSFTKEDAGQYQCIAKSTTGDSEQKIYIDLAEIPSFLEPLQDRTVGTDKPLKLRCRVDGKPYPEVKWFKDWRPLANSSRIKMTTEDPYLCYLTIEEPLWRDTGVYTCMAVNEAGSVSTSSTVTVQTEPIDYNITISEIEPKSRKTTIKQNPVKEHFEIKQDEED